MDYDYWLKQAPDKPLFPDIEWSKPEQRSQAGKLGIIGGNKLGFAGVAEAYTQTHASGVGYVKVLIPEALKKSIPSSITDTVFAPNNQSGGLSKEALPTIKALGEWSDGLLMIGEAGRSSETAILYEQFIGDFNKPLTITRDAVDLLKNSTGLLIERPNTTLVVSFAQLQKIFQSVYYPKVLTFSMQLSNLVEAIHKFTITYPACIVVLHKDNLVFGHSGRVVTMPWENPMAIWRGSVASMIATYWLWNPNKPLEAAVASLSSR